MCHSSNGREVAIVYYRAGYDPAHYKTNKEWDALLKIEMSKAVKCPTIGTFLAGMKKTQEFLAQKANLLALCDQDESLANSLDAVFAKIFQLDSQVSYFRHLN